MKGNGDKLFILCRYPEIVHSVKWKYDYLLFKKKKKKKKDGVAIPFKRI